MFDAITDAIEILQTAQQQGEQTCIESENEILVDNIKDLQESE